MKSIDAKNLTITIKSFGITIHNNATPDELRREIFRTLKADLDDENGVSIYTEDTRELFLLVK
jgi:hypothetical protein